MLVPPSPFILWKEPSWWRAKMASFEVWIHGHNAYRPHYTGQDGVKMLKRKEPHSWTWTADSKKSTSGVVLSSPSQVWLLVFISKLQFRFACATTGPHFGTVVSMLLSGWLCRHGFGAKSGITPYHGENWPSVFYVFGKRENEIFFSWKKQFMFYVVRIFFALCMLVPHTPDWSVISSGQDVERRSSVY